MTAQELKAGVRSGKRFSAADIDVVTTATHGIMSGTAASFSVPVTGRGEFRRATKAWINGVEGQPGPAPNERLGIVDMMIYGTSASRDSPQRYGGGHLFRDLVERNEATIEIVTDTGQKISRRFTLDELTFARMYNFRNCFRSYMAFGNLKGSEPLQSIFAVRPMGPDTGITAIGSGEVNPLQNDPKMRTIGIGSLAMVNDAPGVITGFGTLSYPDRPNLSIVADMFAMQPQFMGGVVTSDGVEVLNAVSIPIPVLNNAILQDMLSSLDENLPLPVADVSDRLPLDEITYADVWVGTDLTLSFSPSRDDASRTEIRAAALMCPVGAIDAQNARIDESRCIRCGACAVGSISGVFSMNLGSAQVLGKRRAITFRTSDRIRAMELMQSLKQKVLAGSIPIREKLMDIVIRQPK